jgi:hypothetical protein
MNYKLRNRVSAQRQEAELILRLKSSNITGTNNETVKSSDPIDVVKPKLSSWSESSARQEPLPYW